MQSRNMVPSISANFRGVVPFTEQPIETQPDHFVTGVTRDSNGAVLGFCRVALFLTKGDVFMGQTTSDVDGVYTFYSTPGAHYYVVSYLTGSPDVFGTTLNTLDGEIAVPVVTPPPATIGTQVNTDDFNRSNQNPIAGNWATSAGTFRMALDANHVIPNSDGNDCDCRYSAWVSGDNQYSQAAITTPGTSATSGMGVLVRGSTTIGTVTYYSLVVDSGGNYELAKLVAASKSSLRTGTLTYVAGQKLGLSVTGSSPATLKIWYNAVQIGTDVTDASSPITTGRPGIYYSSFISACVADDWDAGTVP